MLARARSVVKGQPAQPAPLRPDGAESLWQTTHVSGNVWCLDLKSPFVGTGSAVQSITSFLFYHAVIEIRVKHTDSGGADAATYQSLNLKLGYGALSPTEYNIANTSTVDILLSYRQAPKALPGGTSYIWTTTTPATDLTKIQIILEVLKK